MRAAIAVRQSLARGQQDTLNSPALVSVRAPLDQTRTALLGLGALAQDRRSVALDLGDHLLVLDFDAHEQVTIVAVGGPAPLPTATWLAHQFEDLGRPIAGVLPPLARSGAPAAT